MITMHVTYRTWMDREGVNIVVVRSDHSFQESVLDPEDDSELCPAIQLKITEFRVVDLIQRGEMNI